MKPKFISIGAGRTGVYLPKSGCPGELIYAGTIGPCGGENRLWLCPPSEILYNTEDLETIREHMHKLQARKRK